jgi:hypothetical protein
LQGGAKVIKSIAVSRLLKSLAPSAITLLARRLTLLALALKALKLLLPSRTIGLFTLY